MIEQQLDAEAYMASQAEPEEVQEAEQAFAEAVKKLIQAAPQVKSLILELESQATGYAVCLSEHYFWSGVRLGLTGKPKEARNG